MVEYAPSLSPSRSPRVLLLRHLGQVDGNCHRYFNKMRAIAVVAGVAGAAAALP